MRGNQQSAKGKLRTCNVSVMARWRGIACVMGLSFTARKNDRLTTPSQNSQIHTQKRQIGLKIRKRSLHDVSSKNVMNSDEKSVIKVM